MGQSGASASRTAPRSAFLLFAALAATLIQASASVVPKTVTVTMQARWQATPLLLEAGEFLADESPRAFWDYIAAWVERPAPAPGVAACLDAVIATAGAVLPPASAKLLDLMLSVRSYSPRVEMFRSLSETAGAPPAGRCCWVVINGRTVSTPEELATALAAPPAAGASSPELLAVDHVYPAPPGAPPPSRTAVLYGMPTAPGFGPLHAALVVAATGDVRYLLRPVSTSAVCAAGCPAGLASPTGGPLPITGYGVALAAKNMEYSTRDDAAVEAPVAPSASGDGATEDAAPPEHVRGFHFDVLVSRRPAATTALSSLREHLLLSESAPASRAPLRAWEVKDLGLQATQRITASADPLRLLGDMSANLPDMAHPLSRVAANATLRIAIAAFQRRVPGGIAVGLLNGRPLDLDGDVFALAARLRSEVASASALDAAGLPASASAALLRVTETESPSRLQVPFTSPLRIVNDIEKDEIYARWPRALSTILQPSYRGLPTIRRNVYTVIVVVDPSTAPGLAVLDSLIFHLESMAPARFALWLVTGETTPNNSPHVGALAAAAYDQLAAAYNLRVALALFSVLRVRAASGVALNVEAVRVAHAAAAAGGDDADPRDAGKMWSTLVTPAATSAASLAHAASTASALAAGLHLASPCFLVNGALFTEADGGGNTPLEELVLPAIHHEMRSLQEAVYYGRLKDATPDIYTAVTAVGGYPRLSPRVLPARGSPGSAGPTYVALGALTSVPLTYVHAPGGADHVAGVTHVLAGDMGKPHCAAQLQAIAQRLVAAAAASPPEINGSRLALVPTGAGAGRPAVMALMCLIQAGTGGATAAQRRLLAVLASDSLGPALATPGEVGAGAVRSVAHAHGWTDAQLDAAHVGRTECGVNVAAAVAAGTLYADETLHLPPGHCALISNGRLFAVESQVDVLASGDIHVLEMHESRVRGAAIAAIVDAVAVIRRPQRAGVSSGDDDNSDDGDDVVALRSAAVAVASSVVALRNAASARAAAGAQGGSAVVDAASMAPILASAPARVTLPAIGPAGALLTLEIILDPLSKTAQKLAPLLLLVRSHVGLAVTLVLNPTLGLASLPLDTFYRYAAPGAGLAPPQAHFAKLPQSVMLTMHMDVPEPWLVEPVIAAYDLDNVLLEALPASLVAVWELTSLLLTGHCVDAALPRTPPRGVQLLLSPSAGNPSGQVPRDTIVMSNLGYFQLKAAPGVWRLSLARGRSAAIYAIAAADDLDDRTATPTAPAPASTASSALVHMDSFHGRNLLLRLSRRPGRERDDVLATTGDGAAGSWAGWVANSLSSVLKNPFRSGDDDGDDGAVAAADDGTIHVFSLASGHLYERLLKIMILTVLKHTTSPVKFWFLTNYASPAFKDLLPHLAAQYHFRYEFMTYKWPSWLHKQTDKQRIIWGYKILFLDVLFPLSVTRIIYVDSDQLVRADLAELRDLDLQGYPYAYTPFCDDNQDVEGFRFWKQGFWKEHLKGKPYHISALYVVDLAAFRQMAAGDSLRVVYESLSKDPNSLANLDQDLPNYAQHQLPILSLPQEWLWCATWCSNATLAAAKSIDLCNSPLTKEPKLSMARRIGGTEWAELDLEASSVKAPDAQDMSEPAAAPRAEL